MEFGLSILKSQVVVVPNQRVKCDLFLRRIYLVNTKTENEYKYLILNPFLEVDEDVAHYSPPQKRKTTVSLKKTKSIISPSVNQISSKYLGEFQTHKIDLSKVLFSKDLPDIDFNEFKYFSPEKEQLSLNNQMVLLYDNQGDMTNIKVVFSNMRLVFIIPDLSTLFRFYIDYYIDLKEVDNRVKAFVSSGPPLNALKLNK